MKQRKKELGYSYEQLSQLSGLPVGTISKVLNGYSKAPRYATLAALERVLSPQDPGRIMETDRTEEGTLLPGRNLASENRNKLPHTDAEKSERDSLMPRTDRGKSERGSICPHNDAGSSPILRESSPRRTRQGVLHTRAELDALPDDVRMELIDGVFYDMAAPSARHQTVLLALARQFADHIDSQGCEGCELYIAPFDVVLDNDEYTVVEPDLLVFCHEEGLHWDAFYGAPDLALEILSPSTKIKDQFIKLNKYRSSGVREYWIVDPEKYTVTVYLLSVMRGEEETQAGEITIYSFDDEVPVWISSRTCLIDMKPVKRRMDSVPGRM